MLIIESGQEATKGYISIFFNMKVCCGFSLESPHRGDCNEYTQYTFFNVKQITLNYPKSAAMGFFSKGIKNEFETIVLKVSCIVHRYLLHTYGSNNIAIFGNCLQKLES